MGGHIDSLSGKRGRQILEGVKLMLEQCDVE